MAFNVTWKGSYAAGSYRDDEDVQVQIVSVERNGVVSHRMEARAFGNGSGNNGYVGPTKSALTFNSTEDVETLIDLLQEAVSQWNTLGLTGSPQGGQRQNGAVVARRRRNDAAPAPRPAHRPPAANRKQRAAVK